MRLPRMTTRRWMIDVVVVAMLVGWIVGAEWLRRRRDEFLSRARWHSEIVATWNASWRPAPSGATLRLMAHHGSLASKYRYAVRYPWLPVEPDPPAPE
jgi:hypothetical protein